MIIRKAKLCDAINIANLHVLNLGGSITSLGKKVAIDFYTKGIEMSEFDVYLSIKNGTIVGFMVITKNEIGVFNRILFNNFRNFIRILFISNKISLLKSLVKKMNLKQDDGLQTGYSLLYLAVDSNYRNYGTGKKLILYAEDSLREKSIGKYHLQVKVKNVNAINFYLNNGFVISDHVKSRDLYIMNKKVV